MNLPTELVLEQMILLADSDLNNFRLSNKRYGDIYDSNEDYIFTQKIKRKYGCIESPKDIYRMLASVPYSEYQKICKRNFKRTPNCSDLRAYSKEFVADFNALHPNQIPSLLIEFFGNMLRCSTTLKDPVSRKIIREQLTNFNIQVGKHDKISSAMKSKWKKWYDNNSEKILSMK